MERGGSPVKSNRKNAKTPLRSTCQPMAMYFSWDRFSSKFQRACNEAERSRRKRAAMGIMAVNVP
jgi:hypothetical protein